MKAEEMYQSVWVKYLPVIKLKLKQTVRNGEPSHIGMYKFEFHLDGKSKNVGRQFDLELRNGRVVNDISKIPVAKALNDVMKNDIALWPLVAAGHFNFSLDGGFVFTIEKK